MIQPEAGIDWFWIDAEPGTADAFLLERATYYVGLTVLSFSTVENIAIEWTSRLSRIEAYQALRDRYPPRLDDYMALWSEVIEAPGPLQRHRARLRPLVALHAELAGYRNALAHSRLTVTFDLKLRFERYKRDPGGRSVTQLFTEVTPPQIRDNARRCAAVARLFERLRGLVDRRGVLPPL